MGKKELVIIAGSCYPNNSATGAIALQYADILSVNYNIRLISLQEGNKSADGIFYRGVKVYTLSQWRLRLTQLANQKISVKTGIKKGFYTIGKNFLRLIGRIQALLFVPDNCWWYKKKAYLLLEKLNNEKNIDVVISFSAPIESHYAAMKFKKTHLNVRWICYWGDLYTTDNFKLNVFISMNKMKQMESKLIKNSDYAIMTDEIYEVLKERYENEGTPMVNMPYTMKMDVLKSNCSMNIKENDKINFVCIGSFYRNIRNPEYMLNIFCALQDNNYILKLYTQGNCTDIVTKYVKKSNGRIIDNGIVSPDELFQILKQSDVMVNIENSIKTSKPSKILELMSYRKPIINFYYPNCQTDLLDDYPLSLQIQIGSNISEVRQKIVDFYNKYRNKHVSYEYMINSYGRFTSDNISEKLLSAIRGD